MQKTDSYGLLVLLCLWQVKVHFLHDFQGANAIFGETKVQYYLDRKTYEPPE